LRPGVEGVSENIRVRSVVGRFLEHARVYLFANAGQREVWCSSADWMERNLSQRVEVAFPIDNRQLQARIIEEFLAVPWQEGMTAWDMQPDGTYQATTTDPDGKIRHPQRRLLKVIRP
jgi:polyphosphate kinase